MDNDRPTPDHDDDAASAPRQTASSDADRRVEARRRFLRAGASGSAMLMLTVTHKRAFAGKKGTVASAHCGSLQGVPDLQGIKQKKALEVSAMGTPKGLVCRPLPPNGDPYGSDPVPSPSSLKEAKYFDNPFGNKTYVHDLKDLNKGLGSLEVTLNYSGPARLYDKGWCPVILNSSGQLQYDTTAVYYKGSGEQKACKVQY